MTIHSAKINCNELGFIKTHSTTINTPTPASKYIFKCLFLICIDALSDSFFWPKTYLSNLFSRFLALPFYSAHRTHSASAEEIGLVFLHLGFQEMGMGRHCTCMRVLHQMGMGCKRQGREDPTKLKRYRSCRNQNEKTPMVGQDHMFEACMGCIGQGLDLA